MKYSVWPQTKMNRIPKGTREIHLVRPLAMKKIQTICEKRPIENISCSQSCFKRLKTKTKKWTEQQNIRLDIQQHAGRPLKIPLKKMARVIELVKDHRTYREIEESTSVPKSTAHYLIRYAQRDKIKQNGSTVFL
ncbi:hypothetical protein KKE06_04320 [Candidatus Micrarchaeota archaeon]|nr:hypothetical protein [Candidatus Micrarchaeota archaeon]MBU1930326.1 hypothetical protein [Candidatus Micrarchaeota archaeon]